MTSPPQPRAIARVLRAALLCVALSLASIVVASPAQAANGSFFAGTYASFHGVRDYHGYVPSSYVPGNDMPLVVALHGCTENDVGFDILSGWSAEAEARGFIVVFPDQNNFVNPAGCWNWFLPSNQHRGGGEPAIIAGITNRIASNYDVDDKRTYVTGVSAGGVMANIMTVAYPDVYAASSVLAGCEYHCDVTRSRTPEESGMDALAEMGVRARSVPTLIFQGTADVVVAPVTADRIAGQWTTVAGTDAIPDTSTPGQVPGGRSFTHLTYTDDAGRVIVEQYMIDGAGHAYPGGCGCSLYGDTSGPDATAITWDFFAANPMP
ncbi:alpha/beta hydrolase family esterase [Stackebrandtia soli]|uniref:extracellular catalytic domain type 1 short-chain-length polyhydroxyalkanoate depolymerase n=1 Tax=Stackebrandtia soli TaxID=1892856 RepID=UPI0039E877A1